MRYGELLATARIWRRRILITDEVMVLVLTTLGEHYSFLGTRLAAYPFNAELKTYRQLLSTDMVPRQLAHRGPGQQVRVP